MKEAIGFLNSILNTNDTLVVAVSGGPDSMLLLSLLNDFKNKYKLKIICAHVNHKVRKESEEEAIFVENYCQTNNIIFEYKIIEKYTNNKFSETEARNIRYSFFEEIVKKYNAKYLFTAHHGDDLIETIMMRIVRGSNLKGYMGITKISDKKYYKLVRPLLYLDKEEILSYLKINNIKYVIDKSNSDESYTRNRYRKYILPFLKKEDKNVHQKFLKFSEELESNNNYIKKVIIEKYNKIVNNNCINIKLLLNEEEFIQIKVIEYLIENIQEAEIFDISKKQLNNILKLVNSNNKNCEIDLCNGFICRKSYHNLYIEKKESITEYNYIFNDNLDILKKFRFKIIKSSNLKSNNILRINSSEIKLPLIIRTKKHGDKIKVKNLNGTKKVKDIFIDEKLDLIIRKEYPIVTDSNDTILWIPGIKKSIFDKEKNENYDIIIKYEEIENE